VQTSAGIAWLFYLVSQDERVQRKMQEEIDRVLADRDFPTYAIRLAGREGRSGIVYIWLSILAIWRGSFQV